MSSSTPTDSTDQQWDVDYLVQAKVVRKTTTKVLYSYLVKWTGYELDVDEHWEPAGNLTMTSIEEFWKTADTGDRNPQNPHDVKVNDMFVSKIPARRVVNVDDDFAAEEDEEYEEEEEEVEEVEVEPSPRRSGRLSGKASGPRTRSASQSRPRQSPSPQESEGRETRSSARLRGKAPAETPASPPRLRSAMKRLRVSSADVGDGTASEESASVSRAPAKRTRRGRASGVPDNVEPEEIAGPAFLASVKVGPPRKNRQQLASSARAGRAPASSSSSLQRLSHRRPPPPEDDESSSTRSQSRTFVPMDPSARIQGVPEPALSRKYASIATQTEGCTCEACKAPQPEDEAQPRRSSARTRPSEPAAADFVPNGLLSTPQQGPVNVPESSSSKTPAAPRPSQASTSAFSSTIVGTSSDGTPFRKFHVGSRSSPRPRLAESSRSASKAPAGQPARSSPLKPRATSEYFVSTALSQIRDYSVTPDLESDFVLDEKDDEDPIENDSPSRANAPSAPSSSKITLPVPVPPVKVTNGLKAPRLSAMERQSLLSGSRG